MQCSPTLDFKVGNKVFVKAQFFWTTQPSKKLSKKYLRLYEIIVQPSTLLFTLCLPESMCSVHPVFHVSMLEPATSNTFSERIQPAPAPVIIDGEPEYEISRIVDSKINRRWACKLLYKVIWLGYEDTGDESEWISASKLTHAADLVSNFHITYLAKPGSLPLSWLHCCPLPPCISNRDFSFINLLVYSVHLFSLTLSFCALFGVSSQNFKLLFILILVFLTHTFNSQRIKNSIKREKQNQYTNKRWMMESPSPDFLWGHPLTSPLHLHSSPSHFLLLSPISTLSWPQFSPIGPCSSPGPPPSLGGTSQLLSTPLQAPGVSFQWHLELCYKWGSWPEYWYWCEVYTTAWV